jgi:hypothetical protein
MGACIWQTSFIVVDFQRRGQVRDPDPSFAISIFNAPANAIELITVIFGLYRCADPVEYFFGAPRTSAIHLKTEKMYHWDMKQLILAILIVIAAQPLQASSCAMDTAQTVQHAMDTSGSDADCCDHEQPGSSDSCDPQMHCGAAPSGVAVIDAGIDSRAVPVNGLLPFFKNRPLSPSFDPPLYRPPIS